MCTGKKNRARVQKWFRSIATLALGVAVTFTITSSLHADEGRRLVVNAQVYPWSAIGRVNAGGGTYCTGFLISERHVLTAGHCLYDRRTERWRKPAELHFVAAYQFEEILIHSRITNYKKILKSDPLEVSDLGSAARDWAIITLQEPIGRSAGWLGMTTLEEGTLGRIANGDAVMIQAGYGAFKPHALTLNKGCEAASLLFDGTVFAHRCKIMDGDSGSPWILYMDGRFYAIGLHVRAFETQNRRYAGALSLGIFSDGGKQEAREALRALGVAWESGRPPSPDSPTRKMAKRDLDSLLLSTRGQAAARFDGLAARADDLLRRGISLSRAVQAE